MAEVKVGLQDVVVATSSICSIDGARGKEALEALEIDRVGGHADYDARLAFGRVPHGADVTDGAVEEDALDALDIPARRADGKFLAVFVNEAERLQPWAGKVLGEQFRKRFPE